MMLSVATFSLAIVEVILLFFHGALSIILFIAVLVLTLLINASDGSDVDYSALSRTPYHGYSTYTPVSASTYNFGNTLTSRSAVETPRTVRVRSQKAEELLHSDATPLQAVFSAVDDVLPTPILAPVSAPSSHSHRPTSVPRTPGRQEQHSRKRATSFTISPLSPLSRRTLQTITTRSKIDPDDVPIPPYALVVSLAVFLALGIVATVTQFGTDIATAALSRSKANSPLVVQLRSTRIVMWITVVDQIIIFLTGLLVVIFLAVDGVFGTATGGVAITPILFLVFLIIWGLASIIGFARLFTLVRDYRRLKRTPPSEDPANQSQFDMVQGYYAPSHMAAHYYAREQPAFDLSHAPGQGLQTRAADGPHRIASPQTQNYPAEGSRQI